MILVVELLLDSGMRRYTKQGVVDPAGVCEARLMQLEGARREISSPPGEITFDEGSFTLADGDNAIKRLIQSEPIRNRRVNIKIGLSSERLDQFTLFSSGLVRSWAFERDRTTIVFEPRIVESVDRPLAFPVIESEFPALPVDFQPVIAPRVFGAKSSPDGAFGAFSVSDSIGDARFIAALGQASVDQVFLYGQQQTTGFSTQFDASLFDGLGATIIVFTSNPDDFRQIGQVECTWNGTGPGALGLNTDNPADQLRSLLVIEGFDVDNDSFAAASAALINRGITSAGQISDPRSSVRRLISDFAQSSNISVFASADESISVDVPRVSADVFGLLEVDAKRDVELFSLRVRTSDNVASSADVLFNQREAAGESRGSISVIDDDQIIRLLEDKRIQMEAPYAVLPEVAERIASDRLFFLREQSFAVSAVLRPEFLRSVSLGQDIIFSHFAGLDRTIYRVLAVGIDDSRNRLACSVLLTPISEAQFGLPDEWISFLGEETLRLSRGIDLMHDSIEPELLSAYNE